MCKIGGKLIISMNNTNIQYFFLKKLYKYLMSYYLFVLVILGYFISLVRSQFLDNPLFKFSIPNIPWQGAILAPNLDRFFVWNMTQHFEIRDPIIGWQKCLNDIASESIVNAFWQVDSQILVVTEPMSQIYKISSSNCSIVNKWTLGFQFSKSSFTYKNGQIHVGVTYQDSAIYEYNLEQSRASNIYNLSHKADHFNAASYSADGQYYFVAYTSVNKRFVEIFQCITGVSKYVSYWNFRVQQFNTYDKHGTMIFLGLQQGDKDPCSIYTLNANEGLVKIASTNGGHKVMSVQGESRIVMSRPVLNQLQIFTQTGTSIQILRYFSQYDPANHLVNFDVKSTFLLSFNDFGNFILSGYSRSLMNQLPHWVFIVLGALAAIGMLAIVYAVCRCHCKAKRKKQLEEQEERKEHNAMVTQALIYKKLPEEFSIQKEQQKPRFLDSNQKKKQLIEYLKNRPITNQSNNSYSSRQSNRIASDISSISQKSLKQTISLIRRTKLNESYRQYNIVDQIEGFRHQIVCPIRINPNRCWDDSQEQDVNLCQEQEEKLGQQQSQKLGQGQDRYYDQRQNIFSIDQNSMNFYTQPQITQLFEPEKKSLVNTIITSESLNNQISQVNSQEQSQIQIQLNQSGSQNQHQSQSQIVQQTINIKIQGKHIMKCFCKFLYRHIKEQLQRKRQVNTHYQSYIYQILERQDVTPKQFKQLVQDKLKTTQSFIKYKSIIYPREKLQQNSGVIKFARIIRIIAYKCLKESQINRIFSSNQMKPITKSSQFLLIERLRKLHHSPQSINDLSTNLFTDNDN